MEGIIINERKIQISGIDSRILPINKGLNALALSPLFIWAAIGNRTRIRGSTNPCVNRYTIVAMYRDNTHFIEKSPEKKKTRDSS